MRCAKNCVRAGLGTALAIAAIHASAQPAPRSNAATIAALDKQANAYYAQGKISEEFAAITRAANLGGARDQFRLCEWYEQGTNAPAPDFIQAMYWCMKADAQGGFSPATYGLFHPTSYIAWLYQMGGHGLPQDLAQARTWYQKAVNEGDYRAAYSLGLMYSSGQGGPQDLAQARAFFQIAANAGYPPAKYALAQLNAPPAGAQPAPAPQQAAAQQGQGTCAAVYIVVGEDNTYGQHYFYGAAWSRSSYADALAGAKSELMNYTGAGNDLDPRQLPDAGGQYAATPAAGSGCTYAHGAVAGALKIAPGGCSMFNSGCAAGTSILGAGVYDKVNASFSASTDAAASAAISACQANRVASGDTDHEVCNVIEQW